MQSVSGLASVQADRYAAEYRRCLEILEHRLAERDYMLGDYSIADMASWPWVLIVKPLGQALDDYPDMSRWRAAIRDRLAMQRGFDLATDLRRSAPLTEEKRRILFTQFAQS